MSSAAAKPAELARGLLRNQCLVDGNWVDARTRGVLKVRNPASGELLGLVPDMDGNDTRRAIEAAAAAFKGWAARTAKDRATTLRRWAGLVRQHQDELAEILTLEQGKPLSESRAEIQNGTAYIDWFAEEATRLYGDYIPSPWPDRRLVVMHQPIGVCAAITPWNFPNSMIARKLAPALAVGCTVVLKPAEQTPLSALALAELSQRAGFPRGVVNVVTGNPVAIGAELCTNSAVRKLSFTGSTEVGRLLMGKVAPTLKKVSLELGGNAPFIVFDDADIDAALEGAMVSKFRNSGQTCVCANRIFIHDAIYDAFATVLADRVRALKVGPGTKENVDQGPLIDEHALVKVQEHVSDALSGGGRILAGGRRHALGGTYYEPTVIVEAQPSMRIFKEETFGPVAALFRFKSDEEVIALANDSQHGLAAYMFSRDIGRIWRVAEALEYGMVGVNSGLITTEVAPFGGVKQSGIGREGSKYGVQEFVETKYLCLGGI